MFIRDTLLHYHDWKKTEIEECAFNEYVKQHSKKDKKSSLFHIS